MGHTKKQVALKDIYLDSNNPRHNPINSEKAIIAQLLKTENVKKLAKHITTEGTTSPLENIGVYPSTDKPGSYIVAEGNRRICALKLLNKPELASEEADIAYFKKLSGTFNRTSKIDTIVFDSRVEAEPWMELRHGGEQDGVGLNPWDPTQKTRFNGQRGKKDPNAQALMLIDYAESKELVKSELLEKIKLTTVTRFLGNPVFRNMLGLKNKSDLKIQVSEEEFNRVLKRFFIDAINKKDVTSRSKAPDVQTYANKLEQEGVAPKNKNQPVTDLTTTQAQDQQAVTPPANQGQQPQIQAAQPAQAQPQNNTPAPSVSEQPQNNVGQNSNPIMANTMDRPFSMPNPGEDQRPATPFAPTTSDQKSDITPAAPRMRNNQSPNKRKKVIPSSYAAKIYNPVLKRIYDELRTLEADDFPFAANYLMRAFIENLMDIYLKQEFGSGPKELHKKFDKVSKRLEEKKLLNEKQLKFLNTLTVEKDNPFSPDSVGHYVHGGSTPIKEVILTLWDNLEEVTTCILRELK